MPDIIPPSQAFPLPPWARALFFLARTLAATQLFQQFETAREIQPGPLNTGDPDATVWAKVVIKYEDTDSQDAADDQQLAIELVNYTGDLVDNSWTDGDFNNILSIVSANLITPMLPYTIARMSPRKLSIYLRAYADYDAVASEPNKPPPIFLDTGPPVFSTGITANSTGIGPGPPQGTSTVTERTPSRNHWGRNYMPTLAGSNYGPQGRLNTATVDSLCTMWANTYEALHNADFIPVVPTTQSAGQPVRALQQITGLRVDNVADVIRRRRHKYKTYFKDLPVPA